MFQLHIVHYNVDLFKNIGEAVKSEYGLAVLGMFVKVSPCVSLAQKTDIFILTYTNILILSYTDLGLLTLTYTDILTLT